MLTVGWSKWAKIGHPRLYRSMLKTIYGRVLNTRIPYKGCQIFYSGHNAGAHLLLGNNVPLTLPYIISDQEPRQPQTELPPGLGKGGCPRYSTYIVSTEREERRTKYEVPTKGNSPLRGYSLPPINSASHIPRHKIKRASSRPKCYIPILKSLSPTLKMPPPKGTPNMIEGPGECSFKQAGSKCSSLTTY